LTAARKWGELWHLDGTPRLQRNAILRARNTDDYSFTEWIYGPTALTLDQEPALYQEIPLASIEPASAS
jgi:salicylate hydroxylase